MRQLLLLLALIASALGQDIGPTRISPDDAAKHSLKGNSADYPSVAQTTNIQGNVILEVGIDETGRASVRRLVTGHPLLAPAAIAAVNRWKYQPFEVGGKAAPVVTFVMVTFGNPSNHAAEDRAELVLQDAFWGAIEAAQAALAKHDYASAEEQMNKAKSLVPPDSADLKHVPERWQWMTRWDVSA